jgi:chorismate-pyruvate lyase
MRKLVAVSLCSIGLCLATSGASAESLWPNTAANRWQALAQIESLNAEILASRSATSSLEKWCGDHRLAAEPKLVADAVVNAAAKPVSPEQRQRLGVGPDEVVKYRHVRLRCGAHVLSEADNWYVPSRLTDEMNRTLETTDTPFGRVVRPLEPYRRTFEAKLLWSPLSVPATAAALDAPQSLFEHRAILFTSNHQPFSEVDEVYQRDALDFPPEEK